MLINVDMFKTVDSILTEQGIIEKFEQEHGKITGRMMITTGEIPKDLDIKIDMQNHPQVFDCSFDFCDTVISMALYTATKEVAAPLWITRQTEDAKEPEEEWIEFFIQILIENIKDDGSFGIPMYTFFNNTSNFTVVPELP